MRTVLCSTPKTFTIKGSRFIGQAFHLWETKSLGSLREQMVRAFPGATHYAWAYRILPGHERAHDDGEPAGTAGLPILRLLVEEDLVHTALFVVRYFGGVKLGHGGLVRAYQQAARQALEQARRGDIIPSRAITVEVPYDRSPSVENLLMKHGYRVTKNYSDQVALIWRVPESQWPSLWDTLVNMTAGRARLLNDEPCLDIEDRISREKPPGQSPSPDCP